MTLWYFNGNTNTQAWTSYKSSLVNAQYPMKLEQEVLLLSFCMLCVCIGV